MADVSISYLVALIQVTERRFDTTKDRTVLQACMNAYRDSEAVIRSQTPTLQYTVAGDIILSKLE